MTTNSDKQRYLVAHDYGQGGIWSFVLARSAAEIEERFCDHQVVESSPSWLTGDILTTIERNRTYDADAIKPDDWIAKFLR
jgi:hypothetical protein